MEVRIEDIRKLLQEVLNEELRQIVLSNSISCEAASKVKIRPILKKGELMFQQTLFRGNQVFHKNLKTEETIAHIEEHMQSLFRQVQIDSPRKTAVILVSKKGRISVKIKENKTQGSLDKGAGANALLAHDREKNYLLKDGVPVDFLIALGVQTREGRVVKAKYDKFRQINRYLEFVEDILCELPKDRTIKIVDFGCGKSYLTFAMYYYLHIQKGLDVSIVGLDLKKEVIERCSELAARCGYEGLTFKRGDISGYQGEEEMDMVVSLHACDTATDFALEKAVKWGAKVIFAVPCCQHEINRQISCPELKPILKYGIVKERMSALITDGVRANLLELWGYDTQILEFIDIEHTPKNLLIRGVKRERMNIRRGEDLEEVLDFLKITPTLKSLLEVKC